jgi:hypothetical protein
MPRIGPVALALLVAGCGGDVARSPGGADGGTEDDDRADSSVSKPSQPGALADDCVINRDCASPLLCAFGRCHVQCDSSRDCEAGQRCIVNDRPYDVCQLVDERSCADARDCPDLQICGADGECRDRCQTDSDCVVGEACDLGVCLEPGTSGVPD